MTYPLVRELATDGIPVAVTCRVLKIARQPNCRWLNLPVTDADLAAAYRATALFDAHRDDPEFGYRFLLDEAGTPDSRWRSVRHGGSALSWVGGRHSVSMGRVGAAGDNAAMESFFALLEKNVLDRCTWATREELRIAIVTWIERTYHRRRRQAALGRLTPAEYELIMLSTATQAA